MRHASGLARRWVICDSGIEHRRSGFSSGEFAWCTGHACRHEVLGRELVVAGAVVRLGMDGRRGGEVEHDRIAAVEGVVVAATPLRLSVKKEEGSMDRRDDMVQRHGWWVVRDSGTTQDEGNGELRV